MQDNKIRDPVPVSYDLTFDKDRETPPEKPHTIADEGAKEQDKFSEIAKNKAGDEKLKKELEHATFGDLVFEFSRRCAQLIR